MTANQITPAATLHPATRMGPVTLAVSDLSRSVDFYTQALGLAALDQSSGAAAVGAGGTPLLHLQALPGARRQPTYSTGLYHVALRLPSRADLGRVILNLARQQVPIGGFGDHYVSEAMYLDDPDGNGLEIYRDRPRETWRWNGRQVVMGTEPVDVEAVVASVEDPEAAFAGMPEGTTVGHVHLRVGDISRARAFYSGLIGFDVVAEMYSALFVSAGGYHHHLGMNTWHSRSAPPAPADSVGLRQFTILVPDADVRDQIVARLGAAGVPVERQESAALVDDPWNNRIHFEPEQT